MGKSESQWCSSLLSSLIITLWCNAKYRNKKLEVFIQGIGPNGERIITHKPECFSVSNWVPIKGEVSLSTSLLKCFSQLPIPHPCVWKICFLSLYALLPSASLENAWKFTWPRNGKGQIEQQSSALMWFYLLEEIIHHKLSWRCVQTLTFTNKTEENPWWLTHLLLFSYSFGVFPLSSSAEVL